MPASDSGALSAMLRASASPIDRGAANGTINREVGVQVRMLRLAFEHNKLLRLPIVHKPKEAVPRSGFFEAEQYEAVRRHLPEDLQTAAAIAYTFGWRTQSEVRTLTRAQVDLDAGVLRLEPEMTKDHDGREAYMTPDLRRFVAADRPRAGPRARARPDHSLLVPAPHEALQGPAAARLP